MLSFGSFVTACFVSKLGELFFGLLFFNGQFVLLVLPQAEHTNDTPTVSLAVLPLSLLSPLIRQQVYLNRFWVHMHRLTREAFVRDTRHWDRP